MEVAELALGETMSCGADFFTSSSCFWDGSCNCGLESAFAG